MTTITLKTVGNVDVVYVLASQVGNTKTFISAGSSLLAQKRLVLQLKEGPKTNRVVGKLSIPTVGMNADGIPVVSWTEVGSFDLGAVLAASSTAANDFMAQFVSLAGSDVVKTMYTTGVQG